MNTIKKVIGLWGFLTLFCMGNVVAQSQFTDTISMSNLANGVNDNNVEVTSGIINDGSRTTATTSGLTIIEPGNVGIGTTNPIAKLVVVGTTYLGNGASIGYSGTHYDEFGYNIGFTGTNNTYTYRGPDFAASIRMGYSGAIEFRTAPSGTTGNPLTLTERMRITLDGNVGIGTTSPTQKLHVAGNAYFSGNANFSGNVGIGTTTPDTKLHVSGNTYLGGTASIGYSGQSYDEFGYNIGFTGTSNTYTYRRNNYAASIRMGYNGSIEFRTAPSGTSGANLTLTERMKILENGNVGIGFTNPTQRLSVAGNVNVAGILRARDVIVDVNIGADFVFSPSYPLRPLSEVEQFITANKHLPDIAPADTMIQNGVNMGEFQIQLLQKIEELTLYVIEQQKQIEAQSLIIDELKKDVRKIKSDE